VIDAKRQNRMCLHTPLFENPTGASASVCHKKGGGGKKGGKKGEKERKKVTLIRVCISLPLCGHLIGANASLEKELAYVRTGCVRYLNESWHTYA